MIKGSTVETRVRAMRPMWGRKVWLAFVSLIGTFALVIGGFTPGITAAIAAGGQITGTMQLTKQVQKQGENPADHIEGLAPGENFDYLLTLTCNSTEAGCAEVVLTDPIPSPFTLRDQVSVENVQPSDYTLSTDGGQVKIQFKQSMINHPEGGLVGGKKVVVRVPVTSPAQQNIGTQKVPNTATATSTTAETVQSTATVQLDVPLKLQASVKKDWNEGPTQFKPGAESTVTLTAANRSNAPVGELSIVDPSAGSTVFDYYDLKAITTVKFPEGATTATLTSADGQKVTFGPSDSVPAFEHPESVTGLTVQFTSTDGDKIVAGDKGTGSIAFTLSQRATNRTDNKPLGQAADQKRLNRTTATVSAIDPLDQKKKTSDPVTADKTQMVTPLSYALGVTKSFGKQTIAAHESTTVDLVAKNNSNDSLKTLTISEPSEKTPDFFKTFDLSRVTLEGWPDGADSAVITWKYSNGQQQKSDSFGKGTAVPDVPTGSKPLGYVLEFTSTNGITAGASVKVKNDITENGSTPLTNGTASYDNEVGVTGTTFSGAPVPPAAQQQTIKVVTPQIVTTLGKNTNPSTNNNGQALLPGATTIVSLPANTLVEGKPGAVPAKSITVTDQADNNPFWDAFDATRIAPTAVPSGAKLTVTVTRENGAADTFTADGGTTYSTDLPAGARVTGITFTLTNDNGLATAQPFTPAIVFTARATKHSDGQVTYPTTQCPADDDHAEPYTCPDANPTVLPQYVNTATSEAVAIDRYQPDPANPTIKATGNATDQAAIKSYPGKDGPNPMIAEKQWNQPENTTLADQTNGLKLGWGVRKPGADSVTISDPSNDNEIIDRSADGAAKDHALRLNPYNAYDLTKIQRLNDPLMKWDKVAKVELLIWNGQAGDKADFDATDITAKTDLESRDYPLTDDERAHTIGVRITIEPDNEARDRNAKSSNPDSSAPASGTGVASSVTARSIRYDVQLRNVLRDTPVDANHPMGPMHGGHMGATPAGWVVSVEGETDVDGVKTPALRRYNLPDTDGSVVRNTVNASGKFGEQTSVASAYSDVKLVDPTMSVQAEKMVCDPAGDQKACAPVWDKKTPEYTLAYPTADVHPDDYPKANFTISAKNTSPNNTWHLWMVDPIVDGVSHSGDMPAGQKYDPKWAMEYLNITHIDLPTYRDAQGKTVSPDKIGINPAGPNDSAPAGDQSESDWYLHGTYVKLYRLSADHQTLTDSKYSLQDAAALSPEDLRDVVALYAEFEGYNDGSADKDFGNSSGARIAPGASVSIPYTTQLRQAGRTTNTKPSGASASTAFEVSNTLRTTLHDEVIRHWDKDTRKDDADALVKIYDGQIKVSANKTVNGQDADSSDTAVNVTLPSLAQGSVNVGLDGRQDAQSTVDPTSLQITDDTADFWKTFGLKAAEGAPMGIKLTDVPSGADRLKVSTKDGAGIWHDGASVVTGEDKVGSALQLPDGVELSDVRGLRVTFTRADGAPFAADKNDTDKTPTITLAVGLRPDANVSNLPVEVPDTVQVHGERTIGTGKSVGDDAQNDGHTKIVQGDPKVQVQKSTPGTVRGAESFTMSLTVTNNGTSYLTDPLVQDKVTTDDLVVNTSAPVSYKRLSSNGTLPLDENSVRAELSASGAKITWPQGSRMTPGESIQIDIPLIVKAGSKADKQKNSFGVRAGELTGLNDQCTAPKGGRAAFWTDDLGCTTDNEVEIKSDAYVDAGGTVATDPMTATSTEGANCTSINASNRQSQWPCAGDTRVGNHDTWTLNVVNGGGVDANSLDLINKLPAAGDDGLQTNTKRGSTFTPNYDKGSLKVFYIPSDSADPVQLELSDFSTVAFTEDPNFTLLPSKDGKLPDDINWVADSDLHGQPTGFRLIPDLAKVAQRVGQTDARFISGAAFRIQFTTTNTPSTRSGDDKAPVDPSEFDVEKPDTAWNSFSFKVTFVGAADTKWTEGRKAGVILHHGSLLVSKKVSGGAVSYAAPEVTASVVCTVPTGDGTKTNVPLGADAKATLVRGSDGVYASKRISRLPLGASCHVTEDGQPGAFGETARPVGEVVKTIAMSDSYDENGQPTNEVPAEQLAQLENRYDWGTLSITKKVDTQAQHGSFGPFGFELECTSPTKQKVMFGGQEKTSFTLKGGDTWHAPENTIPQGSTCSVTETDVDGADKVSFAGDRVTLKDDQKHTADVVLTDQASVDVTNHFGAGTLSVKKDVAGTLGDQYGTADFGFHATCTYKNESLFDGDFSLKKGAAWKSDAFPTGTQCDVRETSNGSATSSSMNPLDGKVTIAPQTETDPSNVTVTATNTFDPGQLSITKKVETKADHGSFGPFGFELVCTSPTQQKVMFGGQDKAAFTLKDGDTKRFDSEIPTGSTCLLKETDSSKADSTVITGDNVTAKDDGWAEIKIGTDPTAVVSSLVTNHYDAGTFTIAKKVDGNGADTYGTGSFGFQAVCKYGDQELLGGDAGRFELKNGESKTFGVYPAGTECQTTETSNGGATASTVDPTEGKVTIAKGDTVTNVTATHTNTFDAGSLKINKKIDGAGAETYGAGPFTAQAVCTYQKDGETVPVALPNDGTVELTADNGYQATIGGIIKGASCEVAETDAGGAEISTVDPADGKVTVGGSQDEPTTVNITNTFKAGYVTVEKQVDGAGAEQYGSGEFDFNAVCTLPEGSGTAGKGGVDTTAFTLKNGESKQLGLYPVGTSCAITELTNGGATSAVLDPEDGTVTVPDTEDAAEATNVTVTAKNTFDVGSIDIVKKRVGVGVDAYGKGPFEAQAVCTYPKDGETAPVELPNDGKVELNEQNGYRASIDNVLVGADCQITETETGGADVTTMDPQDGKVTLSAKDETKTVTITNEFNTAPPTPAGDSPLARTGTTIGLTLFGAAVLMGGAGLILLGRSRRRHQQ